MHAHPATAEAAGEPVVYIVDDLAEDRRALQELLNAQRLACSAFERADQFDAVLQARSLMHARAPVPSPACLLLDLCANGSAGPALFEQLAARGLQGSMPVIFLTAHGDMDTVSAMFRLGAFDFLRKPVPTQPLLHRIGEALAASAAHLRAQRSRSAFATRVDRLSERQRHIASLLVRGLPNKAIARQLEISVRTVEANRARIFQRLHVRSAIELAVHMSRFGPPEAGHDAEHRAHPFH